MIWTFYNANRLKTRRFNTDNSCKSNHKHPMARIMPPTSLYKRPSNANKSIFEGCAQSHGIWYHIGWQQTARILQCDSFENKYEYVCEDWYVEIQHN